MHPSPAETGYLSRLVTEAVLFEAELPLPSEPHARKSEGSRRASAVRRSVFEELTAGHELPLSVATSWAAPGGAAPGGAAPGAAAPGGSCRCSPADVINLLGAISKAARIVYSSLRFVGVIKDDGSLSD